jgi:hypothetical protein
MRLMPSRKAQHLRLIRVIGRSGRQTRHGTTPAFLFIRLRDIEVEGGYVLAGQLILDLPKGTKPKKKHERYIRDIIGHLTDQFRSG